MPAFDRNAARITWTAAVTLLMLAAIYMIRGTLVVFAVAILLAYLLHPLFRQISRLFALKNRVVGIALTYVLVISVLAILAITIAGRVAVEARQILAHPPDVRAFLDDLRAAHPTLSPALDAAHGRIIQQLEQLATALPRVGLGALAASANLIYLVIIPILSFFVLKDGERIRDAFVAMFGNAKTRAGVEQTLDEVHDVLLQYMRALLALCCTALVVLGVALTLMGVHYALLLATLAFFCEFVPLAGPIAEIVVILAVSALTGYPHVLALAAGLGVFRIVQDYAIWPKLMSKGIELHPLLVIFAIFAGGQIGGVAGVFFAVPVVALARLILFPVRNHSAVHHAATKSQ